MRTWLQKQIIRRITDPGRLDAAHRKAATHRQRTGEIAVVRYFHRPADPVSALMAPLAARLARHHDVIVEAHLCGLPEAAAAPEPDRLRDFARRDSAVLAARFGLNFSDPGSDPDPARILQANRLVAAASADQRLARMIEADAALWSADPAALDRLADRYGLADDDRTTSEIEAGTRERDRLGHFQSGTLEFNGEWFWGPDRLHYLEARLAAAALHHADAPDAPLLPVHTESRDTGNSGGAVIEVFPSLRSPYTYIAMQRTFDLAARWKASVNIRYVLPMVMRNLPVPQRKGIYFLRDTKREAMRHGLPFGNVCDPRGRPTERGLAVLDHAIDTDRGPAFLTSFLQGVWADGIDAGSDRGLRRIAERAGLDWRETQDALAREGWRAVAEANRQRLFDLGLWGVPSFHLDGLSVWGQDRLWQVEDKLRALSAARNGSAV